MNSPILSASQQQNFAIDVASMTSLSRAAGSLIGVGSDLFAKGYDNEAMTMFDVAYSLLQRQQRSVVLLDCILPQEYLSVISKHLQIGNELLKENKREDDENNSAPYSLGIVQGTSSQSTYDDAEELKPADLYQEDECDVGPRILKCAVKLDTLKQSLTTYITADLMEGMILFNKGLVSHSKGQLLEAKKMYDIVLISIQQMLVSKETMNNDFCWIPLMELSMRLYNNLGVLRYHESLEHLAASAFEASMEFAKRLSQSYRNRYTASDTKAKSNDSFHLEYATVLSNWCRVQWMRGDVTDHLYAGLCEVLSIRTSLLKWDHPDVAAAHYNAAVAEYNKHENTKALSHLMQYLSVVSHRSKELMAKVTENKMYDYDECIPTCDLDAIPALIFFLLIQNEDKDDHMSQELVRGLRTLQEKRQDQGPHSSEVSSVLNFVGTVLFHKNDFETALVFFHEELRIEDYNIRQRKTLSSTDNHDSTYSFAVDETSVSVTCNNIGRILQELNRYSEAIYFYHRALKAEYGDITDLRRSLQGKKKKPMITGLGVTISSTDSSTSANLFSTVWYNLGLIHDKLRSYDEAIFAFEMSLELRKAMLGVDHPDIACLLYNIGVLQMEQQRLTEATICFREALRIRLAGAAGQLNDRHVIKTLEKLASLFKAKGDCRGALEISDEILKLQMISPEYDEIKRNLETGITLRSISELHHAKGDLPSAIQQATISVLKLRATVSLRNAQKQSEISSEASSNSVEDVEQLVSSLLLLGSLYHETSEIIQGTAIFQEAAKTVVMQQDQLVLHSLPHSSLNALREVTAMLARGYCSPCA